MIRLILSGKAIAILLAAVFLAGIVGVCDELGIRVIAEGIETPAERDCLSDAGVDLMQGYLFAKPAFRSLAVLNQAGMSA